MVTSGQRAGALLSVNVGMPQDVTWQGRTVHTAVWKKPVTGPRMVRRLNIDGDGQGDLAGHGGEQRAVLVYQDQSYRHWEQYFGRDKLSHGSFGENFTVTGSFQTPVYTVLSCQDTSFGIPTLTESSTGDGCWPPVTLACRGQARRW